MKRIFVALIFTSIFLLFWSCSESGTENLVINQPPETDLFVSSGRLLNYTQSIQKISWDGRDPDGFVVGFYYTWKENPAPEDWTFTTERSLTFPLEITGTDTIYLFQVKAVDDDGAEDPTPAKQRFPIKNTPPEISWTPTSQIPDTTFTVAVFTWKASDIDGDSTIVRFEYTLDDDTTSWRSIPGFLRTIVLNADSGLTPNAPHSFLIRAVDVAGSKSNIIRMPEDPTKFWYVKEPKGRYLLIDDYEVEGPTSGYPDATYRTILQNVLIPRGEDFSYWNIEELFPASMIQFKETIMLFDRIIWYTDISQETDDHFIAAQVAIPEFNNRGGKIIYSTMFTKSFGAQGDPLAFSPVDSLVGNYRLFPGYVYYAQPEFQEHFPDLGPLPELKVSKFFAGVKALVPKGGAVPLYRFDDPSNPQEDPMFIILGRNDNTGEYDFVFSATPLHMLNGNNNLEEFFDIILNGVFK